MITSADFAAALTTFVKGVVLLLLEKMSPPRLHFPLTGFALMMYIYAID